MTTAFIIVNQYGQYLSKQDQWLFPNELKNPFVTVYHDQALNTLVENNSHNITLRLKIVEVETTDKAKPIFPEHSDSFEKLPSVIAAEEAAAEEQRLALIEEEKRKAAQLEEDALLQAVQESRKATAKFAFQAYPEPTSTPQAESKVSLSDEEQEQLIARMLAEQNALLKP